MELEDDEQVLGPGLACPICHGTYKNPLTTSCCGNSYCKSCLEEALMVRDSCPMCRTPLVGSTVDTITPNRALESFLENGRVVDLLFQEQSGKKERKSTGKLYSDIGRLSAWSACVRTCTFLGGKRGLEMLRSVRQQFRTSRQSLETMRCLLYMLLVGIVLVFLRVNEQDWAERQQHGGERVGSYRSTGQLQNL